MSKLLVPNEPEQETLRAMVAWRTAGWKLEAIAKELNRRGTFAKLGGPWQAGNVDSVMKSRHTKLILNALDPALAALTP